MPDAWEDPWDDADDLFDDPSSLDEDEPTIECPYCQAEIHEDAQRCPNCERYVSQEDAPMRRKPWWLIVGAALCLYAVYRWSVG